MDPQPGTPEYSLHQYEVAQDQQQMNNALAATTVYENNQRRLAEQQAARNASQSQAPGPSNGWFTTLMSWVILLGIAAVFLAKGLGLPRTAPVNSLVPEASEAAPVSIPAVIAEAAAPAGESAPPAVDATVPTPETGGSIGTASPLPQAVPTPHVAAPEGSYQPADPGWIPLEASESVPVLLTMPPDWESEERRDGDTDILSLTAPATTGSSPARFRVERRAATGALPFERFSRQDAELAQIPGGLYCRLSLRADDRFQEIPAASWNYTRLSGGIDQRATVYGFRHGGDDYEIWMTVSDPEYDRHAATFAGIIASLRFVDGTPTGIPTRPTESTEGYGSFRSDGTSNLRSGPGEGFPVVGSVPGDTTLDALSDPAGTWVRVRTASGADGYTHHDNLKR